MLLQVHRCLSGRAPKYLRDKFVTNRDFGCRETRGSAKLHLLHPVTEFYRRSFEYQGGLCWNKLPDCVRTITSFKQVICCFVECFYSFTFIFLFYL